MWARPAVESESSRTASCRSSARRPGRRACRHSAADMVEPPRSRLAQVLKGVLVAFLLAGGLFFLRPVRSTTVSGVVVRVRRHPPADPLRGEQEVG